MEQAASVEAPVGDDQGRRRRIGRIASRRIFEEVRTSGRPGRSGPFTVYYLRKQEWTRPCVAYAVGRRVGGAVQRNRVRRRLRALIAGLAAELPEGAYLVRAGPGTTGLAHEELRTLIIRALRAATAAGAGANGGTER